MRLKAYVKDNGLYIPDLQLKGNKKEVWVNIDIIDDEVKEFKKELEEAVAEHYEEEKKKEISIDFKKIEEMARELGLKGITLEDLINGKF